MNRYKFEFLKEDNTVVARWIKAVNRDDAYSQADHICFCEIRGIDFRMVEKRGGNR